MKNLLIVYHSQSGTTAALAQAVRDGASAETDVNVSLVPAMAAGVDELSWADGVLIGASENFGYLCGGMLDFFARCFYPLQERQINIPYAAFLSVGNDGSGAVRQIERVAQGFPLKKIAEPMITKGALDENPDALENAYELGLQMAAGLAMGVF